MKRKHPLLIVLLVSYLALSSILTWAQTDPAPTNPATETVSGSIVTILDRLPIKGTRIVIVDEKSDRLYTTQQNAKGEFSITLPEGYYVVLITEFEFKPFAEEIALERGKPVNLIVTLKPNGADWDRYVTCCR